ncbi:glycosyltransferase [Hyunsoonleella pacifica]|uniref:Glycosyltransferase n=1 Tax=Hyunsoonleella pacifica TaxID=1080224 RepID=A0A4Q9FPT3_9FLAO|nr:glycosyltransferase [Hyunsoonleella pacifica]TBN16739.1 glycosyltransferase [Hyunsoonleella pacifica]GGD16852.1 glycosyl transferase [Hyunsoonleella pacifica]
MIKKIAHITTVHYRYDVRIHYKYCKTLSEEKDFKVFQVVSDGLGPENFDNLSVIDLGSIRFGRIGRFFLGNIKVINYCLKTKMDLFHFHDPELLPSISLLKLFGKKVVFDMHENFPSQILTKSYLPKLIRVALSNTVKFFQNVLFKFIPVIFAEHSYVKHFKTVKHKETILNYPLKKEFNSISEVKMSEFTLGYMGSVTFERGVLVMLEVVSELRRKGRNISIIFVGPMDDNITDIDIVKRGVSEGWAVFKGRLKAKDGWRLMAQCHIGMAVLKNSPNFIESYPTKLFEYMLLKLPIITSNFPLYKKIIDDAKCGIVVDPASNEEICSAILEIENDETKQMVMGENGKKTAIEKYSWETSELTKIKTFYNKVNHS